jgi:hypothetical protein
VVIDNLNIVRTIIPPHEAEAPLVIYADAVLPFAITLQGSKLIARRHFQRCRFRRGVELQQLASRDALDIAKAPYRYALKQFFSVSIGERNDHRTLCSVIRNLSNRAQGQATAKQSSFIHGHFQHFLPENARG